MYIADTTNNKTANITTKLKFISIYHSIKVKRSSTATIWIYFLFIIFFLTFQYLWRYLLIIVNYFIAYFYWSSVVNDQKSPLLIYWSFAHHLRTLLLGISCLLLLMKQIIAEVFFGTENLKCFFLKKERFDLIIVV